MRILHFIRCFTDDCGAYIYLSKLRQACNDISHYFLAYERIPHYDDGGISILSEIDVAAFLKEIQPDIVHFHDNYTAYMDSDADSFWHFFHQCADRIRVRTIHDYSQAICPNYLRKNYGDCHTALNKQCLISNCIDLKSYEKYQFFIQSLKDYDALIVFSELTKERLEHYNIKLPRVFKTPPLLHQSECYSQGSENIIVFAGRLVQQKGIDYLFRAAAKISKGNWRICLAGKGDVNYIKQLISLAAELKIENHIEFMGHFDHNKMEKLYCSAKIMAFPSISHETYGFCGAEAISHGVPVVAFSIDGIGEWLINDYNGYVVPLLDIDAYAEKLENLLNDKAEYERLRNNCITWSQRLNYKEQVDIIYNFYYDLLLHNQGGK